MKPSGLREWLPALAYDRPVSVLMAFIALLVLGTLSYTRIPVQMMPSGFEPNFLWVGIWWKDATPAETDELIVRPVEAQLGTVGGIQSLRSRASEGRGSFFIRFHSTQDMDEAYNEVVDRIERAMPDLPEDIRRYYIYKYNPDDEPIMWIGVSMPDTVEDPYHVMTKVVQPRLQRVTGVASLDVWGVPQRIVSIDYDAERLYAHSINLGELHDKLKSDNFQMAGGRVIDRGQVRHVRSLARIEDPRELVRYPVKDSLVLSDIAKVRVGASASASIHRIMGKEAAAVEVKKESTANTVDVCRDLAEALEELENDPRTEGAEFHVMFDQGTLITESLDNLMWTAVTGGVFAVFILFAFLREWRMTLLIAASIPFSLLITIGALYFTGGSLNIIALMGLMLAVGMVVDNGIVVIETIYRRRAAGAAPRAAAILGTAEVNLAIVLSTATTMVVFLPVILMSENGQFAFFMKVLGLPVIYALAASLVVALVFAPVATKYIGRAQVKEDAAWLVWLSDKYADLLDWVLHRRADASMWLLAILLLTGAIAVPGVDCTDEARGNINNFVVRFEVPQQAGLRERDEIVQAFEQAVADNAERWGVKVYRSRLRDGDNDGSIYVYLKSGGPMERDEVMKEAKKRMPSELPGVTHRIGWDGGGGGGNSVTLSVHGEDMSTLMTLAREVKRRTEAVEGVIAAHLDVENQGRNEVRMVVDREATARYGINPSRVGYTLSYAMRGSTLNPIFMGEHEIPVGSRYAPADRDSLSDLLDFKMWSMVTRSIVPIRALTHPEFGKGPVSIHREDRRTSTQITLDLEEDLPLDQAMMGISASLDDMVLPRGYSWSKGQRDRRKQEDDAALKFAMLLSVTFVFLLMGVLFESWLLPLSIITAIPMAMTGAYWGLYLTGTNMDTMAGIGLVILIGVVVNNGIVLIDLVTQLRLEGVERTEALLQAGRRRLRPILMTALTTICGLIPMAIGSSAIVGIPYAPLGRTVIGGLAAGTLLTLLFVPYLYAMLDDLRAWGSEWLRYVVRP